MSNGELNIPINVDNNSAPPHNTNDTAPNSPSSSTSSTNGILNISQVSSDNARLLYQEARRGLKECVSISKFLDKRAQIEEEYAKSLLRLCKSYPSGATGSVIGEVFSKLLECTAKQAGSILTVTSLLASEVNVPLSQFVEDLKSELKGVKPETQKLDGEKREVIESLKRARGLYESSCREAEPDPSKTTTLEENYKATIQHVNTYLQTKHPEKLHSLAYELQRTETLRIHKMKKNLQRYRDLFADLPPQSISDLKELSDKLDAVDTKKENQAIINLARSVSQQSEDAEIVFEPIEPVEKGMTRLKSWRATRMLFTNTNASLHQLTERPAKIERKDSRPSAPVFGVPIEVLMERQKHKFPDLIIPQVLVVLLDLIKYLNGLKTEGIFRVPGVKQETEAMRKAFDEGETVEAKSFPNIHTAASVLKLWFRELPCSIIPEDMYYSCLASESPEEALTCFESFPQLHKKILLVILQFFKELLQEENVAKTRMDAENISIVFTPSFMRCSSLTDTSLLANVNKERSFIQYLIASCDHLTTKYNYMLPNSAKENGWRNVKPTTPAVISRPQLSSLSRIGSQNFKVE